MTRSLQLRRSQPASRDVVPRDEGTEQLEQIRRIVRIMDDAVAIPGLGLRVGLDPIIGLLPGAGDLLSASVSGWVIVTAARLGASPAVLVRMLGNAGVDALFGAVPFLGDLFDVAFKAHRKNLRLLEAHLADPGETRRRSRFTLMLAAGGASALLAGMAALLAWGLWELMRAVIG
jgi:hypothetical protein